MASGDLRRLWQLHLVDAALHDMRARAAALDPGRALMAQIDDLKRRSDEADQRASALSGELADLELAQQTAADKIRKIESDLYGGKIVNPREVEAFQKEIEMLRRSRAAHDERILELLDQVPAAQADAQKRKAAMDEKRKELAQHQKQVLAEKSRLEAAFKASTAERGAALQGAPANLLPKYEAILKKYGTGMARITRERSCEACGLRLAEKVIETVKEDKVATCEQCHRILYFSEGVV